MNYPLLLENITVAIQDGDHERNILENINLHVKKGQCIGVSGESGSGKSTLLAVAGTLTTPTSGTVTISGHNTTDMNAAQRAKMRREYCSFIFQSPQLHNALTAREQLVSVYYLDRLLPLTGKKKQQVENLADELLELVGLADKGNAYPKQLSGGQRSRVGIARALMTHPEVLLVDEPTAALDSQRAQEVTELIVQATHEYDIATLFVSHSQNQLEQLDDIIYMKDGILMQ